MAMRSLVACITLLALVTVGVASGALLPCATPETQGIVTTTDVVCDGYITSVGEYAHALSSTDIAGPLDVGEQRAFGVATHTLHAGDGMATYRYGATYATAEGGAMETESALQYSGQHGARATMVESIAVDSYNRGKTIPGISTEFLCPFTSPVTTPATVYPASCEVVSATGTYDITQGAVSTTATGTYIGLDTPLTLAYDIHGVGTGSVGTSYRIHAIDARTDNGPAAGNLQFHEENGASGTFVFRSGFSYTSGF